MALQIRGSSQIIDSTVSLSKIADVAAGTILGRSEDASGAGVMSAISGADIRKIAELHTDDNVQFANITGADGSLSGTLGVTGALSGSSASFSSTLSVTGNSTIGGTLGVTGALSGSSASLSSTLSVTGNSTIGGTLGVTGAASLSSTLGVTGALSGSSASFSSTLNADGNTTIGGTLGVTGALSGSSASFSGNASVGGNLTITGDLTVNGSTTTIDTTNLIVEDPIIQLGKGNSADSIDLGYIGLFNDGSDKYAGLVRDADDSKFRLFETSEDLSSAQTVNTSDAGYSKSTLVADIEGDLTGNADTATALETSRDFSMSGDVAASAVSFDGSGNVNLSAVIQANSVEFSMLDCELDDDTFATASATTVPTSESVKAYVDSQVASGGLSSLEAKDIQMVDSTGSFIKVKEQIVYLEADGTDETNGYVELGVGDSEVEAEFDELSMVFINGQKLRFSTDNNTTNDYYFTNDGSLNFKRLVIDGVYNGDDLEIRYFIKS